MQTQTFSALVPRLDPHLHVGGALHVQVPDWSCACPSFAVLGLCSSLCTVVRLLSSYTHTYTYTDACCGATVPAQERRTERGGGTTTRPASASTGLNRARGLKEVDKRTTSQVLVHVPVLIPSGYKHGYRYRYRRKHRSPWSRV